MWLTGALFSPSRLLMVELFPTPLGPITITVTSSGSSSPGESCSSFCPSTTASCRPL